MKKITFSLCLAASTPTIAQDLAATRLLDVGNPGDFETILFEETYDIGPGQSQTGFFEVNDAPVQTRRIVVLQSGEDCNIYALGILYRSDADSEIRRARQIGNGAYYVIPDGQITELNLYFEQIGPRAVCGIRITARETPNM